MRRKIKLVSLVLVVALMLQTVAFASGINKDIKTVFVDGIKYQARIDENFTLTLKSIGLDENLELVINPDSTGTIKGIHELGENETADVVINELTSDYVDVEIKSKNRAVKRIQGNLDVLETNNGGRTAVGTAGMIVLGEAAIKALLAAGMATTVGTVLCYAVTEIKSQVKKEKGYYYKAYLLDGILYINPKGIDVNAAAVVIKSRDDIYTYDGNLAYKAIRAASIGAVGPENHYEYSKYNEQFFDHYHTADRNGAHAFFGLPQRRVLSAKGVKDVA